jgi:hypothetical protein
MTKYHNKQTEVDGVFFDSKAEARRYQELQLLAEGGAITALQLQPRFLVSPAFTYNGKKERAIHYVADFKYLDTDTDEWVIEDVKGTRTEVYRIKRKLFLAKYGHMYRFEEVAA